MRNDETWKPWAQHDLKRPFHRSTRAPPYTSSSSTSRPPLTSSYFHPYGRSDRVVPYSKPSFFNNPPSVPYQRTPRALPPIVPLKTPHVESWKDFDAPAKPVEIILYARKSAKECSVRWQKPTLAPQLAHSH
uniref:Uncharacterized protein n=1 Tax=Panagrolaimus sp. ES5 TaxID=591445 RepID=A0AC34G7S5_9BILA